MVKQKVSSSTSSVSKIAFQKVKNTTKKYSLQITSDVQGAETFSPPYCSVTTKLLYSKDDGYML